jgi:hypothetical protein
MLLPQSLSLMLVLVHLVPSAGFFFLLSPGRRSRIISLAPLTLRFFLVFSGGFLVRWITLC